MVKVLAFAGSLRRDSYNKKLARLAAGYAGAAGAEVTWLDLRDWPMTLYDGDVEAAEGPPENAFGLQELIAAHQGLLVASPGSLGGMRGLDHVRRVFNTVGALVLPAVVAIPHADEAFDAEGRLKDERLAERVRHLAEETVRTARALSK